MLRKPSVILTKAEVKAKIAELKGELKTANQEIKYARAQLKALDKTCKEDVKKLTGAVNKGIKTAASIQAEIDSLRGK